MPKTTGLDQRRPIEEAIRPIVLLAIDDQQLRATFAYELMASGFDVVATAGARDVTASRPDIILVELTASGRFASSVRVDGIPVVGIAPDFSEATRTLALRKGCAAVCVAGCGTAVLTRGLRAVLARSNAVGRGAGD